MNDNTTMSQIPKGYISGVALGNILYAHLRNNYKTANKPSFYYKHLYQYVKQHIKSYKVGTGHSTRYYYDPTHVNDFIEEWCSMSMHL